MLTDTAVVPEVGVVLDQRQYAFGLPGADKTYLKPVLVNSCRLFANSNDPGVKSKNGSRQKSRT